MDKLIKYLRERALEHDAEFQAGNDSARNATKANECRITLHFINDNIHSFPHGEDIALPA